MKWNLLFFIKNKVFMHLFKTRKVCNVIYCQRFLKAFEKWHWKLLRFLWSSHLMSSIKKAFSKISQNSQDNSWVGVSLLWSTTLSKKEAPALVFSCEFSEFLRTPFFQNTSEQLLLNFTNENKASENEISNWWF